MIVLGLDPSLTNFGWSVHDTEGPERVIARGRFQSSASTIFVHRFTALRERVRTLVQTYRPDRVGIESPIFGASYSEGMYGLFLYSNEALFLERRDVVFFSPMQVKSSAREILRRPKGWKMMKPDMVEAAKKDSGTSKPWDHNEADSYLVGRLAGRFWTYMENPSKTELTRVERTLFDEVHTFTRGEKAGVTEKRGLRYRENDRFFLWSLVDENVSFDGEIKDR